MSRLALCCVAIFSMASRLLAMQGEWPRSRAELTDCAETSRYALAVPDPGRRTGPAVRETPGRPPRGPGNPGRPHRGSRLP
jgi:hypothetical protein